MKAVSALIPSLHGGARMNSLAEQIAGAGAEVLVADNGMSSEAVADAQRAGARVVGMGANVGFARAVNSLAAAARGRTLVILNDDIEPEPAFLDALVDGLGRSGMASGVLLKAEQPRLIETAGIVVDRFLGAYDHLQDQDVTVLEGPVAAPLGPTGGAAAFNREAFDRAGGYDTGFFAYFEDVDLALRLALAGERCALVPQARALHAVSSTLGYDSLAKATVVGASRGRLVRKYGLLRSPVGAAWILATETVTALELTRRHRSLAPARARARGFMVCRDRLERPKAGVADVTLRDGVRRRYARSLRMARQ
jgi:GT2 family glycosyltransferase